MKGLSISSFLLILFIGCLTVSGFSKDTAAADSIKPQPKTNFQIFLKQPAKEIKLLMYEKSFLPIQGKLSEDRKSIIMKDWEPGTRVHVKVIYEDGTTDEFVRSPCYIDPVVL